MSDNTEIDTNGLIKSRQRHATIICCLLLIVIAAMSQLKIQGAVVATGVLTTETRNKKIQLLDGGRVERIAVDEGQRVNEGDALVQFDDTSESKTLESVSQQIDYLVAEISRLAAEAKLVDEISNSDQFLVRYQAGRPILKELTNQAKLLEKRVRRLELEKSRIDENVTLRKAKIQGTQDQLVLAKRRVKLARDAFRRQSKLKRRGAVTQATLDEADEKRAEMLQSQRQLEASINQEKIAIAELGLQREGLGSTFSNEALDSLSKKQRELGELLEREAALEAKVHKLLVSSPQNGTVLNLAVRSRGETVAPNAVIMEIVPSSEDLLIEAQIRTLDRDQVYVGQRATFQISAFDQKYLPQLHGVVAFISADASQPEPSAEPTFVARIKVEQTELKRLGNLKPVPGMPVNVFIATTESNLLFLLTKPIVDIILRAFRE
jgi:HlyD family secretion protein